MKSLLFELTRLANINSAQISKDDPTENGLIMLDNILNAMDSFIYVTDLETDELLFINQKMRNEYGLESLARGGLCWKVLGKSESGRCEGCQKAKLLQTPEQIVSEQNCNVSGKILHNTDRIIDWPDGRKVHMRQCMDITKRKLTQEALAHREKMLNALNSAAIAMLAQGDEAFLKALTKGVSLMAEIADIDRVSVYKNVQKPDGLYASQIFRWLVDDEMATLKRRPELLDLSYERFAPRWKDILLKGECINGPAAAMPEANLLLRLGCVSVLAVPVFSGGDFWGAVLFENRTHERTFTSDETDVLHSASLMIANSIIHNEKAKRIRAADEYAKLMIEAMPLSCVLWDKEHRPVDCNEVAVKLFGFESKEQCLSRLAETYPGTQPDGTPSDAFAGGMMTKAFETGNSEFAWVNRSLDGTPVPTHITLTRIHNGEDKLVVGYAQDLREHRRMMDEIRWRNQLLKAVNRVSTTMLASTVATFEHDLLHSLSIMALAVEADRAYIWKNYEKDGRLYCAQLCEWCNGVEKFENEDYVLGTSYEDEIPEWLATLSRGQCVNGIVNTLSENERAILKPQGVLSLLSVPVFVKGEFWGFIGFDDCHKERHFSKSEEAILLSASRLIAEALVRHDMEESLRASALALQSALVEAQTACQAKSEFLSTMSHEMRTPLNAVIGMTEIGKRALDTRRKDYALDRIEEASTHLLAVINDILDMSKIEAGKLELSPVEFNVEQMLQKVITVVGHRIGEKRQEFTASVGEGVPRFVVGDDQRLAQIITNLLANAVKFTPELGKIHLGVEVSNINSSINSSKNSNININPNINRDSNINLDINSSLRSNINTELTELTELRFEVSDSGIGISHEAQARLFRSFGQAESGISREFGGTGLGLAISKRLVEMMDGRIWVESEPGKGSRFIFTVKVPNSSKNLRSLLSPSVNWEKVRVLVVDASEHSCLHIKQSFERIGVRCKAAANGGEAFRLIESEGGFDVCFIDLYTPGIDAHELTHRIKAKSGGVQIVLISSTNWENLQAAIHDSGADRCLVKPIFSSALVECMNECLGGKNCAQGEGNAEFAGKTLLLAEDIEINREIVLSLLGDTGITIDCAENGMEALSLMESNPSRYDAIFMDIQMPFMDGLEATRRIRALPSPWCKKVPIIAMTANVFKDDIASCMASGMSGHIGKPIDYGTMMDKLRYYLAESCKRSAESFSLTAGFIDSVTLAKARQSARPKNSPRRDCYRIPHSTYVSIASESEAAPRKARMVNFSYGGMLLLTDDALAVNETITLTFELNRLETTLGVVLRAEPCPTAPRKFKAAIEFIDVSWEQRERFQRFIMESVKRKSGYR